MKVEEASEAFNNPLEAIAYNYNYCSANPGYYGAAGTGPEHGMEDDPSHQFSEELRLASTEGGRASWVAGLYYSDFYSLWGFKGTTPNYSAYMDLGTLAPATTPNWFDADRVLSYELGEKARMLDRRLTVNASIYYEDWRHIQLEAYPNDWALNINGNYAHIYGADIDVLADLGAGFQLEVAAGYLYEYLDGGPHWVITPVHKMPEVAPESGTVALSYSKPLGEAYTFTTRLENSYTGPRYSIFFSDPYEFTGTYRQLPGYDLINVRAGVKFHDKWSATAFVNNVTNKHAQLESMFTENEPQPSFTRIETNQPLTGGVDLTYRF